MATFFSKRFPSNSQGVTGDIAIYESMGVARILVKGTRRWFQTTDLTNAGKSLSKFSDAPPMKLKGDFLIGKNRIMANKSTNQGITMDEKEKTITATSSNGLICSHHLIMSRAGHSKIYLSHNKLDYILIDGNLAYQ